MRDWPPMTTGPAAAGALASAATPFDVSVATSSRRMPPRAGAGKASDSRRSPSTTATALRVSPAGRLPNSARARFIGLRGSHLRSDLELDGEIRDVVGQLTADETNRHRAVRQIGDRTRDAGHLFGIGHLGGARAAPRTTKDAEDTRKPVSLSRRALRCIVFVSFASFCDPRLFKAGCRSSCKTCASGSLTVEHELQPAAGVERCTATASLAAAACPNRFAKSRSIWSRYPLPASS